MPYLTPQQKERAAARLRAKGVEVTKVNIAEEAAVMTDEDAPPARGAAGGAVGMGERKAPAGSIEEKLEREADEKRKKGPPASMMKGY